MINEKSCLEPKQIAKYLGFIWDSRAMTVSISEKKLLEIQKMCQKVLSSQVNKISIIASLIGKMISVSSAIKYSLLYTRTLEQEKTSNLFLHNSNFSKTMCLSSEAKEDLNWWISRPKLDVKLGSKIFNMTIATDSSLSGWGAHYQQLDVKTHGHWDRAQSLLHIDVLDILAIEMGLKSFASKMRDIDILLRVDNTVAIAYINRLGGCRSQQCFQPAKRIWQWCEKRNLYLTASYISSHDNIVADKESRSEIIENDWTLGHGYFKLICNEFGNPVIDLFGSYVSHKCVRYISWHHDPGAENVDAFLVKWNEYFYVFPPFCLVLKCLNKIKKDKATGIMIVPYWKSQSWFPIFEDLRVSRMLLFGPSSDLIFCPLSQTSHPLFRKLQLAAAIISGRR